MTTSNEPEYNHESKEITPDTIKDMFNSIYIPDHTVVNVVHQHGESPISASVVDMRVYPNQWVIMAKLENGQFCEFNWPSDRFYT